jgi:hypothetical protein
MGTNKFFALFSPGAEMKRMYQIQFQTLFKRESAAAPIFIRIK